jgi:hypothetical protein
VVRAFRFCNTVPLSASCRVHTFFFSFEFAEHNDAFLVMRPSTHFLASSNFLPRDLTVDGMAYACSAKKSEKTVKNWLVKSLILTSRELI